jgi:serine/threonine protein kinase
MAAVHFGRLAGPSGFARTVAIKRLHPHLARDPDFVAMFLDEARLAARVHHPNVVPTLDVIASDAELLIVMEYVQGESLSKLLRAMRDRGERMPPRIAASVLAGVAHGLHAAHEATDERGAPLGLVHRDVSPQNVLVGADGVARVLDFGVAKATVRLQTTRDGQLKGKIAYMAPEQLSSGAANRLTDVYAAGVLLWEALAGRRLYEADAEGELVAKVLTGHIVPPSSVAPEVGESLDGIAMRAVDLDPARRFPTARDMALALERSGAFAMPSEVGDWVHDIAKDALASRAQRLADIESTAHARPSARPAASSSRTIRAAKNDDPTIVAPPSSSPSHPTPGSVAPPSMRTDTHTPSSVSGVSSGPAGSSKRTRRHVLVIDDSEVMLTRIRQALEAEGYDVTTTSQTVGTARYITTCDLAIIDYHMPGIDGGTVITSLKSAAASSKAASKGEPTCLFYLYTSDPSIAKDHARLGFDGSFVEKGDEGALVRQVRAVFRMLSMRQMQKRTRE